MTFTYTLLPSLAATPSLQYGVETATNSIVGLCLVADAAARWRRATLGHQQRIALLTDTLVLQLDLQRLLRAKGEGG